MNLNKVKKRDIISGRRLITMPLKPKAKERKYSYDQSYLKQNIAQVSLTFNRRKQEDMTILKWLNDCGESKVAYIKRLIQEDIARHT